MPVIFDQVHPRVLQLTIIMPWTIDELMAVYPDEQKLFDAALAKKSVFNSVSKFYPQWITIFAHKLLSKKAYELPDDEFEEELRKQWKKFCEKELQEVIKAIGEQTWIHAPSAIT